MDTAVEDTPANVTSSEDDLRSQSKRPQEPNESTTHQSKRISLDPNINSNPDTSQDTIEIKVQFGKISQTVQLTLSSTVQQLRQQIAEHTGVPPENQKLIFKGQLKDDTMTINETGLKNNSKLMVIGTKPKDIITATTHAADATTGDWDDGHAKKEKWCEEERHKKILDKGRPDDGWPGIANKQIPLRQDQTFIPGLLNNNGTKVRLTLKHELQQLWISSAAHTQKIMYASIHKIEAQTIDGNEGYSIVRLQLGAAPTNNNYWLYYVPSQVVSSIKIAVLGVASLLE